ncbi:hypothetical protein BDV95DRAFT_481455, partial [Massariosphaeria phaeospora]
AVSLPSPSCLAALTGALDHVRMPFFDPTNWSAFTSAGITGLEQFSGYVPSNQSFISTTGEPLNALTMSAGTGNAYDDSNLSLTLEQGHSNTGSTPVSPENQSSSSERPSTPKLPNSKSRHVLDDSSKVTKRHANTVAARRYRQKRVDQMSSLESTLKETQDERDSLKVRCARLEGEVETLRQLLRLGK